MIKKIALSFLLVFVLISCEDDQEEINPIPEIATVDSQVYSTGGVKLEGNILNIGTSEILEYGFRVFANDDIFYNVNHFAALPASQGQFFVEITQGLYPDTEYRYTAYIRTEEETYQGETLTFISTGSATPVLLECVPNLTHIGDTVTLIGENFPTDTNDIEFKFGGVFAQIESITENELTFTVPRPEGDARLIEISAYGKEVVQNGLLDLHAPVITSINPSTAFFGDTISIIGDHFATNVFNTNVTIGGIDAEIVSTSRNEIQVIIPEDVNYSNTEIVVFAQNQSTSYTNFNLRVPQFINVPNMIFMNETFDVTVDATSALQNEFMIGDRQYFPTIIDDTTLRFFINSTAVFEQREQQIRWIINDIEVVSQPITISNPFYKIKDGYNNNFPFAEYDLLSMNDQAVVIGDIAFTDSRKYIYTYDDVSRTWQNQALVNDNGSPHVFAFNDVSYVAKEDENAIYGLKVSDFTDNFIRVDVATGNVTLLAPNSSNSYYGKGFTYQDKIFYTTPTNTDLWAYDIPSNSWQVVSTVPYNISQQRNMFISVIVDGNYAYFANGGDGSQFNDFWRLNLNTYQWEQLPNNPYVRKDGAVYKFNNELHFVTDEQVWKYNPTSQMWTMMEKPGVLAGINSPVAAFIQNGIPYLLRKEVFTNVTYLNLYIGDLVN